MKPSAAFLAVVVSVVLSACEQASEAPTMSFDTTQPRRSFSPDPSYRLSDVDRARVSDIFDVNALERLISMLPSGDRADVLEHFTSTEYEEEHMGYIVHLNDPHLQAVLEEVWLPYWSTVPSAALYETSEIPGRQLALSRQ